MKKDEERESWQLDSWRKDRKEDIEAAHEQPKYEISTSGEQNEETTSAIEKTESTIEDKI